MTTSHPFLRPLAGALFLALVVGSASTFALHGSGKPPGQGGPSPAPAEEGKASNPPAPAEGPNPFQLFPFMQYGAMGPGRTEGRAGRPAGKGQGGFTVESRGVVNAGRVEKGVHPFFKVSLTDEVGKLGFCMVSDQDRPVRPHALAATPDGRISWLQGEGNTIYSMAHDFGIGTLVATNDVRVRLLFTDSEQRLTYVGEKTAGNVTVVPKVLNTGEVVQVGTLKGSPLKEGTPSLAVAGPDGWFWGLSGDRFFRINLALEKMLRGPAKLGGTVSRIALDPGQGVLYGVMPELDQIGRCIPDQPALPAIRLAKGSRPEGIALGPDNRMWVALSGRDELALIDLKSGEVETLALAGEGGAPRLEPHGIALGPDRNMWVTLKAANRIARISAKRKVDLFPLPEGFAPQEICPGHDGRMLFTLAGGNCIGAITAVPMSLPRYGDSKAEPAATPAAAGGPAPAAPAPRKPTRAERHRRHDAMLERAWARMDARLAGAPEAPEAAGEPDSGGEEETDAIAAAPLTAAQRLARHGVVLTRKAAGHVFWNHGCGKDPSRSQFNGNYDTLGKIKDLLAQGIEEAGPVARILDPDGRRITFCTLKDPVGWHLSDGIFRPTRRFKVVTQSWDDAPDEHYVVTAYPVWDGS